MRIAVIAIVILASLGAFAGPGLAQGAGKEPATVNPEGYPYFFRQNFIGGCMEGEDGLPRAVCECGIRNIERTVPYADSLALDRAGAEGRAPDAGTLAQYAEVMRQCLRDPTW